MYWQIRRTSYSAVPVSRENEDQAGIQFAIALEHLRSDADADPSLLLEVDVEVIRHKSSWSLIMSFHSALDARMGQTVRDLGLCSYGHNRCAGLAGPFVCLSARFNLPPTSRARPLPIRIQACGSRISTPTRMQAATLLMPTLQQNIFTDTAVQGETLRYEAQPPKAPVTVSRRARLGGDIGVQLM